jgi:hypothetical protein
MITLEYVVLWKHKPEGHLGRECLMDASNLRLNEVFRNSSSVRKPWKGKMDRLSDYIAEKGKIEPGHGG